VITVNYAYLLAANAKHNPIVIDFTLVLKCRIITLCKKTKEQKNNNIITK